MFPSVYLLVESQTVLLLKKKIQKTIDSSIVITILSKVVIDGIYLNIIKSDITSSQLTSFSIVASTFHFL